MSLGSHRSERGLGAIVVLYLLLIAVIVGYNAHEMGHQRGAALVVNVSGRQRALAERYVKDVIFNTEDIQADPQDDEAQLLTNADALLHGGDVAAVQGTNGTVHIPPVTGDPGVIAKLEAEQRLIEKLVASGDQLLRMTPDNPAFAAQLLAVRVIGAEVTSISNDAVGQMTADTEAAYSKLVRVGIALGIFGAIVAVAMGLLLRRLGARRATAFRSLVHSASDLITVVDAGGYIRYQSPSAQKILGLDPHALLATDYLALVDPEDRPHLESILTSLVSAAEGSATAEYRVEHASGSSRYVESIVRNLLHDPAVNGLVLNTRDVTDRKNLEDELA
ncbi:MAG: PAS domain-containing protein, partial [Actinomycetota bacterium]